MSDIKILGKVRDQVCKQIDRYFDGEVTADATSQIAYAGSSVAYVTSVKHTIERAAA